MPVAGGSEGLGQDPDSGGCMFQASVAERAAPQSSTSWSASHSVTFWLARARGRFAKVSPDSSSGLEVHRGCFGLWGSVALHSVADVHHGLHRVTSRCQALGFSGEKLGDAGLVGVSSPCSGFMLQSALGEIALSSTRAKLGAN